MRALRRAIIISLGRLRDLLAEARCSIPAAVGRAAQPPILPCTGLGFSCRPSRDGARWALTPPFHPDPERAALRRVEQGGLFSVTLSVTRGMWPAVPRLEQKRVCAVVLRPADTARQRFLPGILPGGVRTFLSKLQRAWRYPRLGIKELGATIWPQNQGSASMGRKVQ